MLKERLHQAVDELVSDGYFTREKGTVEGRDSFLITSLGRACYKGQS